MEDKVNAISDGELIAVAQEVLDNDFFWREMGRSVARL